MILHDGNSVYGQVRRQVTALGVGTPGALAPVWTPGEK